MFASVQSKYIIIPDDSKKLSSYYYYALSVQYYQCPLHPVQTVLYSTTPVHQQCLHINTGTTVALDQALQTVSLLRSQFARCDATLIVASQ
jgi:hypothetical protein